MKPMCVIKFIINLLINITNSRVVINDYHLYIIDNTFQNLSKLFVFAL